MLNQKRDIKVLVSADINGRFEQVMPKIAQLHSKNSFDLMLLLGNVCHPRASPFISNVSQGKTEMPLELNFIDNSDFSPVLSNLHPKGKEIVPKFRFLGKNGLNNIKGLNIAFFNNYDPKSDASEFETQIQTFLGLCQNKSIDVLLTNQWPKQIKAISQKSSPKTAEYVSRIVNQLCPHYHFAAGSDSFYRLSPYCNAKGGITHFISVAPCLEQLKDKYLFAVTIKPNHFEIAPEDGTCLQNPFLKTALNKMPGAEGLSIQQRLAHQIDKKQEKLKGQIVVFFQGFPEWARKEDISEFLERWGDIKHLDSFKDKRGGRSGTVRYSEESSTQQCLGDSGKFMFSTSRIKFQARNLQDRQRVQDCWFCKVNTDRSLIVWEGRYVYLCLEKGPLCKFHLQLIPYNHTQSSSRLDPQEQEQLNKVKSRLISHFSDEEYQIISYERCLPLSEAVNHCVVHLLPVKRPQSLTRSFEETNKSDGLGFKEWLGDKRSSQYFLNLQIGSKSYLKEIQKRDKVQADFMRQLLCELLETPKLVNWKICERKPEQLIAELSACIEELKKAGISS